MSRAITLETIRDAGPAVYTVAKRAPLVKLEPLTPNGRGDAVAAALSGRAGSGTIVAVVSGGNIDRATFARIITEMDS